MKRIKSRLNAQSSTEYLMILAAIIAIAVVAVVVANSIISPVGGQQLVQEGKYSCAIAGVEMTGYVSVYQGSSLLSSTGPLGLKFIDNSGVEQSIEFNGAVLEDGELTEEDIATMKSVSDTSCTIPGEDENGNSKSYTLYIDRDLSQAYLEGSIISFTGALERGEKELSAVQIQVFAKNYVNTKIDASHLSKEQVREFSEQMYKLADANSINSVMDAARIKKTIDYAKKGNITETPEGIFAESMVKSGIATNGAFEMSASQKMYLDQLMLLPESEETRIDVLKSTLEISSAGAYSGTIQSAPAELSYLAKKYPVVVVGMDTPVPTAVFENAKKIFELGSHSATRMGYPVHLWNGVLYVPDFALMDSMTEYGVRDFAGFAKIYESPEFAKKVVETSDTIRSACMPNYAIASISSMTGFAVATVETTPGDPIVGIMPIDEPVYSTTNPVLMQFGETATIRGVIQAAEYYYETNYVTSGCYMPSPSCTDSDGGLNYAQKGTTYGIINSTFWATVEDYCSTSSTLVEYSCGDYNLIKTSFYDCPHLCYLGECLDYCAGKIPYNPYSVEATASMIDVRAPAGNCLAASSVDFEIKIDHNYFDTYQDTRTDFLRLYAYYTDGTYTAIQYDRCDAAGDIPCVAEELPSDYPVYKRYALHKIQNKPIDHFRYYWVGWHRGGEFVFKGGNVVTATEVNVPVQINVGRSFTLSNENPEGTGPVDMRFINLQLSDEPGIASQVNYKVNSIDYYTKVGSYALTPENYEVHVKSALADETGYREAEFVVYDNNPVNVQLDSVFILSSGRRYGAGLFNITFNHIRKSSEPGVASTVSFTVNNINYLGEVGKSVILEEGYELSIDSAKIESDGYESAGFTVRKSVSCGECTTESAGTVCGSLICTFDYENRVYVWSECPSGSCVFGDTCHESGTVWNNGTACCIFSDYRKCTMSSHLGTHCGEYSCKEAFPQGFSWLPNASCVNECPDVGVRECLDSVTGRVCLNMDDDPCLEWYVGECMWNENCFEGSCYTNFTLEGCSDCEIPGYSQCMGDYVVQYCNYSGSGCPVSSYYNCTENQTCIDGHCKPPGNLAPVAIATCPSYCYIGSECSFSSNGSYDPDGYIERSHWIFSDGLRTYTPNPSRTFNEEVGGGVVYAKLSVEDNYHTEASAETCVVYLLRG